MSIVRFIADLHLGHEFVAKHRGFASIEEHDEHIIKQWNSVVHKRDLTYILGDVTMEKTDSYPLLKRLNGQKKVVLGNHDRPAQLEYRVPRNIHGHIHGKLVMMPVRLFGITVFKRVDRRYHCVSCEQVDFKPKTLKELGITR